MTTQRLVRKVLTISLLAYLGFGAYLYAFQRAFLYYPVSEPASAAAASLCNGIHIFRNLGLIAEGL